MNPFFQQIALEAILKRKRKKQHNKQFHDSEIIKEINRLRILFIYLCKDIGLIITGALLAGFGLKGFLLPNSFIDGGVTGISLLLSKLTSVQLWILLVLLNLPFIIVGIGQLGKTFAFKSVVAILTLSMAVALIDYPIVTSDKLLVSVFGGFFLGTGIGLSVRGGAVLDGTEALAIYLSKKIGFTIGDIILLFNIIIFSVGAYLLSVETALYSILIYLAASRTVDFIIEGVEEYTGVTIVSSKSEEIRLCIIESLGRGVTLYSGKRGFGKRGENLGEMDIVFTVITRLEVAKLRAEVEAIDPEAFMVMSSIKDTHGGMIKRKRI